MASPPQTHLSRHWACPFGLIHGHAHPPSFFPSCPSTPPSPSLPTTTHPHTSPFSPSPPGVPWSPTRLARAAALPCLGPADPSRFDIPVFSLPVCPVSHALASRGVSLPSPCSSTRPSPHPHTPIHAHPRPPKPSTSTPTHVLAWCETSVEATDMVSTLALPIAVASWPFARGPPPGSTWDCVCCLCLERLLMAIFPPSPSSVRHTIGILFGTGAFWKSCSFLLLPLVLPSFVACSCLLFYYIYGTLLILSSRHRASYTFLYTATAATKPPPTAITTTTTHALVCCSCPPTAASPRVVLYNNLPS